METKKIFFEDIDTNEPLSEVVADLKATTATPASEPTKKGRNVLTRAVEREMIASMRTVDTERGPQIVITTESGKELWASPKQVPSDAEEVRFRNVKAGDVYTYAKEERIVKSDSSWFVGAGKQTVKVYSQMDLQEAKIKAVMQGMAEYGLTNAINL